MEMGISVVMVLHDLNLAARFMNKLAIQLAILKGGKIYDLCRDETICESSISKVVVSDAAVPFIARGGRLFSGQVASPSSLKAPLTQVLLVYELSAYIRMYSVPVPSTSGGGLVSFSSESLYG